MLRPFDLAVLAGPGLIIFLTTLVVSQAATWRPLGAVVAASIKAGIFLLYFGLFFDGTFTFLDDWTYLEGGDALYAAGITLANLAENWSLLLATGNGDHFVYYLYNAYAIYVFGNGYFAPVAGNILLTAFVAYLGSRLAEDEFGFVGKQQRLFFYFLLFQPDLFAWSNVMNGKDILVLLMHTLLLFGFALLYRGRITRGALLIASVSLVLFFLRFYVPLLFSAAFLGASLMTTRGRRRVRLVIGGVAILAAATAWVGPTGLALAVDRLRENAVNPVYGLVRFLLTPIPFNADAAYAFLNIPATIHWLLIPAAGVGVAVVWRLKTGFSKFFLAYVACFVLLYAVYGELQGPRHRLQLDYALAVFQFAGLLSLWRAYRTTRRAQLGPETNATSRAAGA